MDQGQLNGDSQIKGVPLLKWPGGKRLFLKHILPLLPESFNDYYEPFFGGGALFFALEPRSAVLSDNNPDLMNCYGQVRDRCEEVIAALQEFKNTKEDYYRIRQTEPEEEVLRAARFIYLLTLSFNGIYRVNLKGKFNVPYGYKTHLTPHDEKRIRRVSSKLASAELRCADFEKAVASATEGDLVYLDPPYTLSHQNNGFLKYNSKIFSWKDQIRLSKVATDLANRGCKVIVSNADHEAINQLYGDFKVETFQRASVIAASSQYRRQMRECIFSGGGSDARKC
jgi:DNA adenine methylase